MTYDLIVVGGGIVGLATAHRFQEARPKLKLLLLEKEARLAAHQTGNNSGVLHSGLYYQPGSAKAQCAVQGLQQMLAFCRTHGIAHEQCGKIVVATTPEEVSRLDRLWERGHANGLQGLRRLSPVQIKEIEPHAAGLAALHVPQEGIVDYPAVCARLGELIRQAGGEIRLQTRLQRITPGATGWNLATTTGPLEAKFVVTCGGLHADRLVRASGQKPAATIIPFRGEYHQIKPDRQFLVRHLIYPVPDPKFPFLGVHFTRLVNGGVEAGPTPCWPLRARVTVGPPSTPGTWRNHFVFPDCGGFSPSIPACAAMKSGAPSPRPNSPARCNDSCRSFAPPTSPSAEPASARKPCCPPASSSRILILWRIAAFCMSSTPPPPPRRPPWPSAGASAPGCWIG